MNQNFKILFLSNIPTPYQLDFIKEVNKNQNYEMRAYFLWEEEKNRDWLFKKDQEFVYIANFSYRLKDYLNFYKFFINFSPNLVLIGGYRLPLSMLAIILSKVKHIKILFWLERPFESTGLKKFFKKFYIKNKFRLVNGILAIGISAVDIYKNFHKEVFNFPYSLNLDEFYKISRSEKSNKEINFLFSGQLIERKNIVNLVKAFQQIENSNIRLNIIGGGELKEQIEKLIERDSRVKLLGFIQPNDLPAVYAQNDVFIFPSKYDGWGIVVNEAMASAMPVIATDKVGSVKEFIKHKENGFICDIDVESIKEGIIYYLENKSLIYQHGQKNRKLIKDSLGDVKNAVDYLIEIIKNL